MLTRASKIALAVLAAFLVAASGALASAASAASGTAVSRSAAASGTAPAAHSRFVPGEVVVRFKGAGDATVKVPKGVGVREAVRALRKNPAVRYAAPNHVATVSAGYLPGDSGTMRQPTTPSTSPEEPVEIAPGLVGGWMARQWNLLPWKEGAPGEPYSPGGIDAVAAWRNLRRAKKPGGRGVVVAVVDTGVAYRSFGTYRRNPDLDPTRFVPGWDFVLNNRLPLDRNGHGTHVAGTIAQSTDNGIGLAGVAYGAKIMPIRVLDARGNGTSDRIAAGIRWAADRGADVINMSFNFGCRDRVPNVVSAIRYAHRKGAVLVASVGNAQTEKCISPPATAPHVIGVGGTTEGGCLGDYSLTGPALDLVAPGGGRPLPGIGCEGTGSRPIYQVTFTGGGAQRRFGVPERYFGTSMATAHVSGVAALVIASGVLGRSPVPHDVTRRLARTARPPMAPVRTAGYGAGIVDAGAATDPAVAAGSRRKR